MIEKATDSSFSTVQANDYYAFGISVPKLVSSPENNYLYNGKKLQQELGLNEHDYGARFYDPVVGRWNVVDPHAENYLSWTPYNYVANNPIN